MHQDLAEQAMLCSKRRHVRLFLHREHLLRGVSLRRNRRDLRVRRPILGQEKQLQAGFFEYGNELTRDVSILRNKQYKKGKD